MTVTTGTSEKCLDIRLPANGTGTIEIKTAAGAIWRHKPEVLPDGLYAAALWQRVRAAADRQLRLQILAEAGGSLGRWLFGGEETAAQRYLRDRLGDHDGSHPRLRIALRETSKLAGVPWEIATLGGMHMATHPRLSVIRLSSREDSRPLALSGQVSVHIVGVTLLGEKHRLATGAEVETIRQAILDSSRNNQFDVKIDPVGDWQNLVKSYSARRTGSSTLVGPPQFFISLGTGSLVGRGWYFVTLTALP